MRSPEGRDATTHGLVTPRVPAASEHLDDRRGQASPRELLGQRDPGKGQRRGLDGDLARPARNRGVEDLRELDASGHVAPEEIERARPQLLRVGEPFQYLLERQSTGVTLSQSRKGPLEGVVRSDFDTDDARRVADLIDIGSDLRAEPRHLSVSRMARFEKAEVFQHLGEPFLTWTSITKGVSRRPAFVLLGLVRKMVAQRPSRKDPLGARLVQAHAEIDVLETPALEFVAEPTGLLQ